MKHLLSQALALVVAVVTLAQPAYASDADRLAGFSRSSLEVASADGRLHKFRIWVADNDRRRMQGLMYIEQIADDQGMLFVFEYPRIINMWMRNTILPLDMIFIGADGRIVHVAANTTPYSDDTISSQQNALGVLEVKAGTAARLNIKPGAVVVHPAFRPAFRQ